MTLNILHRRDIVANLINRFVSAIFYFFSAIFNIHIKLKYVLLLAALLTGGTYFLTHNKMINDVGGEDDYAEAMRYIEIKDILDDKFIEEVDRVAMGNSAAAAMVDNLGDSWSYHMSADEYRTFQLYSSNEYSDIGITMVKSEGGGFQVLSVNVDSPAAWAGLSPGMIITGVDGQDVREYSVDEVRTLIRSKLNTKFLLDIGDGQYSIEVDCSTGHASAVSYRLEKTEAGYVKIDNFEAGTGQDAINAIEDLLNQNAVAMVIDLRGNPGGLSTELETFLDYLLPSGVLYYESDKQGNADVAESDGMCVQLPMVVLINSQTYREAEVCAAVLKERGWALLMGESTSGNTRTQETIELADGSAIRLSTKSYLTGNGVDICANGGVVPDAIVYNADESATGTTAGTTGGESGTASTTADTQLMEALKYLSTT